MTFPVFIPWEETIIIITTTLVGQPNLAFLAIITEGAQMRLLKVSNWQIITVQFYVITSISNLRSKTLSYNNNNSSLINSLLILRK